MTDLTQRKFTDLIFSARLPAKTLRMIIIVLFTSTFIDQVQQRKFRFCVNFDRYTLARMQGECDTTSIKTLPIKRYFNERK